MQVFQVPMRALQFGSLSRLCSSSVRPGPLCTSHPMNISTVVESRRRVSSSSPSGAAQGSSDEDTKKPTDAPKEEKAEAAAASESALEEAPLDPEAAALARQAARDAIIQEILSRDKVIFELKRQHELSMLRVEQSQSRVLKDQEDRGMYYEQNSNVHTFDTISVGLYSQRSTLYHTLSAERLRNLKIFLMVFTTLMTCVYFYYRYVINPDWAYVEKPLKMIGSRVQAVREQRWRMLSSEERFDEIRSKEQSYAAQKE